MGGEKTKTKNQLVVFVLLIVLLSSPFLVTATAMPQVQITRATTGPNNTGIWYTEYKFDLGGATDWVRIPDNWNHQRLLVLCRGYMHVLDATIPMDAQSKGFLSMGYATAASNYGEGGYCVKTGVIRTHQLTEWFVDNYNFNGYVYLLGASMGGNIVLQLGSTYPNLYDGVFDMFGSKNLAPQYTFKMNYVSLTTDDERIAALNSINSAIPPYPFNLYPTPGSSMHDHLMAYGTFCYNSGTDIWLACGSKTPDERSQAYEKISPVYSATHITVPTITLHGTADGLVPYSQSVEFQAAVQAAGYADMYRLYSVAGKGHGDITTSQIAPYWLMFVAWVETGTAPT
jgi:hypothetical protein